MTTENGCSPVARSAAELWLVRHGETDWSRALRHTGRSDIPLTDRGRRRARALKPLLASQSFARVLVSPLVRARETAELAGHSDKVLFDEDLMEWDYGAFEGQTTAELATGLGAFSIWSTQVPDGESLADVADRAERVLRRLSDSGGRCLLFSHGHFLRILAACWLGLAPDHGRLFTLDAGALSVLGHEHDFRVIRAWNLGGPPPWALEADRDVESGSPG